jgi:cell wall-associated NlpC family hydrolase
MVRAILFGMTVSTIAATTAAAQNSSTWIRVQQPHTGGSAVGTTPGSSTTGFDNSGLMQWSTHQGGKSTGKTSHPDFLWAPIGGPPTKSGAHVGISLGGDRAIESVGKAKPTGGGYLTTLRVNRNAQQSGKGGAKVGGFKSLSGMEAETEVVE